ncbi:MAG: hypothetical protein ACXWZP_09735 [Gaiellaceae bacterium]
MRVNDTARDRTRVQLPSDVTRPFQVYLNGVLKQEGSDYVVRDGMLVFEGELKEEGKLGLMRWTSIVLGIAGSYGRNDSVDVVYEVDGQPVVAAKLPVEGA